MFLNVFDKMINSTQYTHKTILNTNWPPNHWYFYDYCYIEKLAIYHI